jgi:hypothetical protein
MTAAAIVYEETMRPNSKVSMPRFGINSGPSGITTMKSTMLVNWTEARMIRAIRSRRRIAAAWVFASGSSVVRLMRNVSRILGQQRHSVARVAKMRQKIVSARQAR